MTATGGAKASSVGRTRRVKVSSFVAQQKAIVAPVLMAIVALVLMATGARAPMATGAATPKAVIEGPSCPAAHRWISNQPVYSLSRAATARRGGFALLH